MFKVCLRCDGEIWPGSSQFGRQKYCSDRCRKSSFKKSKSRKLRIDQRRANLPLNLEFIKLVNECLRAGTVQILSGHDSRSFSLTMELVRNRPKFDVNLCHVYPVRGDGCTGLFHYQNFFYGGAYQNKVLGNSHFGAGLSIANSLLERKWQVWEGMPMREVLCKIESFLGETLNGYLAIMPVRKSPKAVLAQRILEVSPESTLESLMSKTSRDLALLWREKTKQRAFFVTAKRQESKYVCYLDELSRFISYGGIRSKYFQRVRRLLLVGYICLSKIEESRTFNEEAASRYSSLLHSNCDFHLKHRESWSEFKDFLYEVAFYALQGMSINLISLTLTFSRYVNLRRCYITKSTQ